jgi:hypothetical protein
MGDRCGWTDPQMRKRDVVDKPTGQLLQGIRKRALIQIWQPITLGGALLT